jgi:nucleoside-diphosphate-sugar epimerase
MQPSNLTLLGKNGFIGKHLSTFLISNNDIDLYSKKEFDITDNSSYSILNINENTILFDCISKIDGTEEECRKVNELSFIHFISFLKKNNFKGLYLYFSTTSTISDQINKSNYYVNSKLKAENFLKLSGINYKIIRLTFPFGIGENSNRLISRLVHKLLKNEEIKVDNVLINLTPVHELTNNIYRIIESKETEINFTDNKVYKLIDIIIFLKEYLNSHSTIVYNENNFIDLTSRNINFELKFDDNIFDSLKKIADEIKIR